MISNILRHFGGIEWYGLVALGMFCSLFVGVLVWACLQRKSHLDRMARVPLESEPETSQTGGKSHE